MAKYLEKVNTLRCMIRQNGGILSSLKTLFITDDLKVGTLVGQDQFGNKYYYNPVYFIGRSRWVIFSDNVGLNYDGSQIPPEWHRWMSYMTDETPDKANLPRWRWMAEHEENCTGSSKAYVPYSTTRPKIEEWKPPAL